MAPKASRYSATLPISVAVCIAPFTVAPTNAVMDVGAGAIGPRTKDASSMYTPGAEYSGIIN
jgi:hypothetical protein